MSNLTPQQVKAVRIFRRKLLLPYSVTDRFIYENYKNTYNFAWIELGVAVEDFKEVLRAELKKYFKWIP